MSRPVFTQEEINEAIRAEAEANEKKIKFCQARITSSKTIEEKTEYRIKLENHIRDNLPSFNYPKVALVEVITSHFVKVGQRMTNLKKATPEGLYKIIKKYNIDVGKGMEERDEYKEREKQKDEEHRLCMEKLKKDNLITERLVKQTREYYEKPENAEKKKEYIDRYMKNEKYFRPFTFNVEAVKRQNETIRKAKKSFEDDLKSRGKTYFIDEMGNYNLGGLIVDMGEEETEDIDVEKAEYEKKIKKYREETEKDMSKAIERTGIYIIKVKKTSMETSNKKTTLLE